MDYWMLLKAFAVGGALCAVIQLMTEKCKLTVPKILVLLVVTGAVLQMVRLFAPFSEFSGAGATVPLLGFGASLARGAQEAVAERGWLGIFTGGVSATAAGITGAVLFGFLAAVFSKSRTKP